MKAGSRQPCVRSHVVDPTDQRHGLKVPARAIEPSRAILQGRNSALGGNQDRRRPHTVGRRASPKAHRVPNRRRYGLGLTRSGLPRATATAVAVSSEVAGFGSPGKRDAAPGGARRCRREKRRLLIGGEYEEWDQAEDAETEWPRLAWPTSPGGFPAGAIAREFAIVMLSRSLKDSGLRVLRARLVNVPSQCRRRGSRLLAAEEAWQRLPRPTTSGGPELGEEP